MQDNTSPEERLLRLIRGDKRRTSKRQEQPAKGPEISQTEKPAEKPPAIKKHFSFNLLNRIFLAAFLILGIYLLADFLIVNSDRIEKRILALKRVKGAALEIPAEDSSVSPKPVSYYTEPVKLKELFTVKSSETRQARPSSSFMEMASNLRLQGIISGVNPQAVIQDLKTQQTYFLSPGQRIGEIELKEILPGKVKLNYYGQELELAL